MRTTTTRGVLWEVIAPVLRWPMRSPARLVGVIVAAIAVIWVIAQLSGGHGSTTSSAPSSSTGSAASQTSAEPSGSTASDGGQDTGPTGLTPRAAATGFVTAWARPELSQTAWWKGIEHAPAKPSTSFAQALSQTDPATIPASKVTGKAEVLSSSGSTSRVEVHTDGPAVIVSLTRTNGDFSVTNLLPTR